MKKVKKVLSGILAASMLATMIPLNASAAETKGTVTYSLSVGTVSEKYEANKTKTASQLSQALGCNIMASDTADIEANTALVNEAYTPIAEKGSADAPYVVSKGTTFYLGVDMSYSPADKGGLVQNATPVIDAPKGVFTNGKAYISPVLAKGFQMMASYTDEIKNYFPGASGFGTTLSAPVSAGTAHTDRERYSLLMGSGTGYIPNAAAWDVLVEFTAAGNPGTYKVEVATDTPATNPGAAEYSTATSYQTGWDNDGNKVAGSSEGIEPTEIQTTPIYIKIESDDPTAALSKTKIAKTTERTIDVTLTNASFKAGVASADGSNAATNFEITQKSGTGTFATADIKKVVLNADQTTATLTLDATNGVKDDVYTVKVLAAAADATKGEVPTGGMEAGEVTICEALSDSGTKSIKAGSTELTTGNKTAHYGDTLKAELTGGNTGAAGPLSYAWYKYDAANSKPTGKVLSATDELKLTKTLGLTYGTDKVVCRVTSAALDGTYVDMVVENAVAKKQLTGVPAAPTGVSTQVNAEAIADVTIEIKDVDLTGLGLESGDTVKGTVTVTVDKDNVKDEHTGVNAVSAKTAKLTALTGKDNAYYDLPATVDIANVKVEVLAKGHKFTSANVEYAITSTGEDADTTDPFTVTVTSTDSNYALAGVTCDAEYGTISDIDPVAGTFTFTPAQAATTAITVPLTITKYEKVSLTISKKYDGTKVFDTTKGATITATPTATMTGTVTLADAATAPYFGDVKANVTLTDGKIAGLTGTPTSGDYVDVYIKEVTSATITKGDATKAEASAKDVKRDQDSAYTALTDAQITVNDTMKNESTVGAAIDGAQMDADAVKAAIDSALITAGYKSTSPAVVTDVTVEASAANAGLTATQKINGKVVLDNLPADSTVAVTTDKTLPTGITLENNALVLGADATVGTNDPVYLTVTKDDTTTYDLVITITGQAADPDVETADYDKAAGKTVVVTIPLAKLSTTAGLGVHFDTLCDVKVSLTFQTKGGGGSSSSGFGVSFDAKGYGTATTSYVETDEDGKIISLPEVTDVVKGAVFAGWSTNGKKSGIVKVDDFVAKNDVTLYAVYDGYMIGNEKNQIEAGKQVTRAELIKMLVVASGMYDASKDYGKTSFADANNGWYTNYIACAEQSGKEIVTGYPDKTFRPNEPVTREEAAKFIAATFDVPVDEDATVEDLTDFDHLQNWAKGYVAALYGTGAIDGYPDGTYRGGNNINRDASAKMTNTFLGLDAAARESIKDDASIQAPFTDMVSKTNWAYADLIFASLNAPADYYDTETVIPER